MGFATWEAQGGAVGGLLGAPAAARCLAAPLPPGAGFRRAVLLRLPLAEVDRVHRGSLGTGVPGLVLGGSYHFPHVHLLFSSFFFVDPST